MQRMLSMGILSLGLVIMMVLILKVQVLRVLVLEVAGEGVVEKGEAVVEKEKEKGKADVQNSLDVPERPEYGPHPKSSIGDEQYSLQKEMKYIKERKFICSLDFFLELLVRCCGEPGCQEVHKVKHHFMGATVVVNTLCPLGHAFKFCSFHEVNGMYANRQQQRLCCQETTLER